MFFIQFVGRFCRYEERPPLDNQQHAVVVVPAHPDILLWAREIEHMILASQIKLAMDDGGTPPERKNECIGTESQADEVSLTLRGEEMKYEAHVVEMMCRKSREFVGMPRSTVIKIANDLGLAGGVNPDKVEPKKDWNLLNNNITKQIVRLMRSNGEPDSELYERVNGRANAHVGIPKMDKMTAEETLIRRHAFLQDWLRRIISEVRPDLFDIEKAS
jgi:hypothetical protein